jgi:hypothetical protein
VGLDSAGMLGLFYNPQTREASSSPVLITTGNITHNIKRWDRMNWYALPYSRFEGVLRLLPSQRLRLADFKPVHRPLLVPLPTRSYQETLDELVLRIIALVPDLFRIGPRLTLLKIVSGAARLAGRLYEMRRTGIGRG